LKLNSKEYSGNHPSHNQTSSQLTNNNVNNGQQQSNSNNNNANNNNNNNEEQHQQNSHEECNEENFNGDGDGDDEGRRSGCEIDPLAMILNHPIVRAITGIGLILLTLLVLLCTIIVCICRRKLQVHESKVLNSEQQQQQQQPRAMTLTNGQRIVMNGGGNLNGGTMLKDGSFSPSPRLCSTLPRLTSGTASTHSTLNRSRYQQPNFNPNFAPSGVCHSSSVVSVNVGNYQLPPPPPPPDVAYIALAPLTSDRALPPEIDFSGPQQHHLIHPTMNGGFAGHHPNGHHHNADSFIDQSTNGHIPQSELYRM